MARLSVRSVVGFLKNSGVEAALPSANIRGGGNWTDGWTTAQRGDGVRVWVFGGEQHDAMLERCAAHLRGKGFAVENENGRTLYVTRNDGR